MNLLQLQRASKQYGTKVLFEKAQFAINEGEHVGVIGPNGAGKTTLFKIIVNQITLDSGELIKAHKLNIGYLEQEAHEPSDISAEDYLEQTSTKPLWELKQLGEELGLQAHHFEKPFQALSGGYRMRMKLLALIGKEPNLMLLDEPTNFLDLESIMALEKFLQKYRGAFLLISHDREFLRRTTDHTLEVESGEITKFPGHIDDYFEQKAQMRIIMEAQAANIENKRKHLQDFVDRFGAKATKAKQAQSRVKQIGKLDKIEIKDLPVRARIKIPDPHHTGKETLQITHADLGYNDKVIIRDCTLRLEKGAHLGVVGFNGAGKSTLLKSLAGRIPLIRGELKLGHQVSLGYYAQHVSEDLDPADTVLESLRKTAHVDISTQEVLNLAGSLLFSGEAVNKKVKVLSGGEKSRVALGQILLKRSPLILMDEPTNHLDFDTVNAMTAALRSYPGTLIIVSHDRSFIGSISTQILEIRNGRAEIYPGTYDDYLWSLEKGSLKDRFENNDQTDYESVAPAKTTKPAPAVEAKETPKENYRDKSKHFQSMLRDAQKKIAKLEDEMEKKNTALAEVNEKILSAKGAEAVEMASQLHSIGTAIQELEDQMLEQMERVAQAEKELK